MSERLKFLCKFLLFVTALFSIFFLFGYHHYQRLLCKIGGALYDPKVPLGETAHFPVCLYNIVPFLALMLATPGIKPFTRSKLTGIGLIIFFCVHFLFLVIGHTYRFEKPSLLPWMISAISNAVGQIAIPLIVWFTLTHEYVLKAFWPRKDEVTNTNMHHICPICGCKKKGLADHIKAVHGHETGVEKLLKRSYKFFDTKGGT